jgi:hypothetical protein
MLHYLYIIKYYLYYLTNDQLGRKLKGVVKAYFKVPSKLLSGGSEENKKISVRIAGLSAEL